MKNYELRSLTSDDIFPMFQIISKIGIREFKYCFESPDVKAAIAKSEGTDLNSVGLAVMLDIGGIVLANVPKAKVSQKPYFDAWIRPANLNILSFSFFDYFIEGKYFISVKEKPNLAVLSSSSPFIFSSFDEF